MKPQAVETLQPTGHTSIDIPIDVDEQDVVHASVGATGMLVMQGLQQIFTVGQALAKVPGSL
ncbi:MAG TPA: hypothetical protein VK142_00415 [Bacillota bacterium]|nr:hypothetical protein [Bacillota bacterium]